MTRNSQWKEVGDNSLLLSDTGQDLSSNGSATNQTGMLVAPGDSASDNDASERPVREKLKKTSIASMPKNGETIPCSDPVVGDSPSMASIPAEHETIYDRYPSSAGGHRGRLPRKRSHDDLEAASVTGNDAGGGSWLENNEENRLRKRSRDVHASQIPKMEERSIIPKQTTSANAAAGDGSPMQEENPSEGIGASVLSTFHPCQPDMIQDDNKANQELKDYISSPRRKRSRDEFDSNAYRGQKLAATDEARAQRHSEDSERDQGPQSSNKNTLAEGIVGLKESQTSLEITSETVQDKILSSKVVSKCGSSAAEAITLSGGVSNSLSSSTATVDGERAEPGQATKFQSSGFAALSGQSASPFATISSLSSSWLKPPAELKTDGSEPAKTAADDVQSPHINLVDIARAPPVLGGSSEAPRFETLGNPDPPRAGGFGDTVFGGGFGNIRNGTQRLESFAAPQGDVKLGKGTNEIKTFGAPSEESGEENSSSEEDMNAEGKEEQAEVDCRFQQQDVETGEDGEEVVFLSPRTQLYYFDGKSWHERGKGSFKLNISVRKTHKEGDFQRRGRFIMRAHQTFRVLLNQPVFPKMQVGDSKGREPQGKHFSFAVIDEGRPIPYLLKMADETETKTLYREVRNLQQTLQYDP